MKRVPRPTDYVTPRYRNGLLQDVSTPKGCLKVGDIVSLIPAEEGDVEETPSTAGLQGRFVGVRNVLCKNLWVVKLIVWWNRPDQALVDVFWYQVKRVLFPDPTAWSEDGDFGFQEAPLNPQPEFTSFDTYVYPEDEEEVVPGPTEPDSLPKSTPRHLHVGGNKNGRPKST